MADDISKNIIIQVTAQTDQLEQSISNLNKIIDNLLLQQKKLADTGKEASEAFQNNADKIDIFTKSLQKATTQLNSYLSILNSSATSLQKNQSLITALTTASDKYSKSVGDNSKKVTELNTAIKTLAATIQQQQTQTNQSQSAIDANGKAMETAAKQATGLQAGLTAVNGTIKEQGKAVDENKTSFDAHKLVMEHLKKSFDEVKDVSGEFGPSLQDAAKGFNLMKSGLNVVKDGLTGVGDALKADGFDFLLQLLQLMFDAFIHSSTGTKVLHGAISAVGVVVNKVKGFFNSFMTGIINAVSHPIDSIKALGKMVEQNIINRFTAFARILDGLIHLDFKKVADGAIQAVTGVTDATGKIASTVKAVTKEIVQTSTEIGEAYTKGFSEAKKAMTDYKETADKLNSKKASGNPQAQSAPNTRGPVIEGANPKFADPLSGNLAPTGTISPYNVPAIQDDANNVAKVNKTLLQQLEADVKKSGVSTAMNALSQLSSSIKQQSDAKVAALEKDKNAELSNTSLTNSQKLAIQQKYKNLEDQVKAKAFKEEQEISIAQAIINGALAVTKVTAQGGVLAPLEIGVVVAETAAQVAKIASQKPPAYAAGGLHYTSDGKGGVLPGYSRTDNTNAYLRSGEGVVVSEAMRDPWARNLVSAINVGFGGRDFSTTTTGRGFAVGGIFTDGGDANRYYNQPVTDQKNLANSIAYQMVNNFPPVYVDVKDINNQQNILAQTINRVNL